MSRLGTRGSSKSELFSATDSEEFRDHARRPHMIRWKANAYRWVNNSGAEEVLMEDIPIISGTLTLDSSDQIRRKLSLEVGGASDLEPRTYDDPLVPFGQFIRLWMTIDRPGGGWFPWLRMGEFAIQSYVYERPSQIATVEALDYSSIVNEFLHEKKKTYKDLTLAVAVDSMVRAAMPDSAYKFVAHSSARSATNKVKTWVADAASPRWEEALKLAESKGFDLFFDWAGDLVLRPQLGTGYNSADSEFDDVIHDIGPDIGTITNPVATIRDGVGGTMIGMTATVTRDGACNGVIINVHETADQKTKTAAARKARNYDTVVDVSVRAVQPTSSASGYGNPIAYGNRFGRIPIVIEKNVVTITKDVIAGQQTRANNLLARRSGVVRYIDLAMLGGYWLEPDDIVKLKFDGREEDHFVQSATFDLKGGATKIRTRQLYVSDPGA